MKVSPAGVSLDFGLKISVKELRQAVKNVKPFTYGCCLRKKVWIFSGSARAIPAANLKNLQKFDYNTGRIYSNTMKQKNIILDRQVLACSLFA